MEFTRIFICYFILTSFPGISPMGLTYKFDGLSSDFEVQSYNNINYDLHFLDNLIKPNDDPVNNFNRIHILGDFSSYKDKDQLTNYILYLIKLTTGVHMIYDYKQLVHKFDNEKPMNSYNSEILLQIQSK